jgi:hypothetical protein
VKDTEEPVADGVFNKERYPGVWNWFHALESYIDSLPNLEKIVSEKGTEDWKSALHQSSLLPLSSCLVPTSAPGHAELDVQRGLVPGVAVSIAPDDTGRDDPTLGTLVKIGVEEVVITPVERGELDVRIHFPRLGFVVRVVEGARL